MADLLQQLAFAVFFLRRIPELADMMMLPNMAAVKYCNQETLVFNIYIYMYQQTSKYVCMYVYMHILNMVTEIKSGCPLRGW